ncbi:MAG: hypothetical protein RR137_09165 [Odoribacter sp.]
MRKIFMFLMVAMCATMFSSCSDDDDENSIAPIDVNKGIITFTTNLKIFEKKDQGDCHIITPQNGKISVDWGDGQITEYIGIKKIGNMDAKDYERYAICLDHIYDQEKTHTVKITGAILGIWGGDKDYLPFTSLDVSKCPALKELDCNYNNFTSLDVSNCPTLRYLACYNTKLTSLDVSKCPALEWLVCTYANLTSLDISNCPILRYLDCHNNNLTSLDVSKNTALINLICDENQFNDSVWNKIYTDLPQQSNGQIRVDKDSSSDPSIAEKKGWSVQKV